MTKTGGGRGAPRPRGGSITKDAQYARSDPLAARGAWYLNENGILAKMTLPC
jgi:hypothetical protein